MHGTKRKRVLVKEADRQVLFKTKLKNRIEREKRRRERVLMRDTHRKKRKEN